MKGIFIIILFLSIKGYSQDFTVKWKVFSYEDEMTYYNKTKDSISYKNPSKKDEADSFKQISEDRIFSVTYTLENNGKFIIDFPEFGQTINGSFEVDKSNKKIVLTPDIDKKYKILCIYADGFLFVKMKVESGYIKLGLMKVSN